MSKHEALTGDEIHVPWRSEFADQAALAGAAPYAAGDVNKLVVVLDSNTLYRILDPLVPTFVPVSSAPATAEELVLTKTGVQPSYIHLGQLAPAFGAGALSVVSGALVNQAVDERVLPGKLRDKWDTFTATIDALQFPDDTFFDLGTGALLVAVLLYGNKPDASAGLFGKRSAAGNNPGYELVWGPSGDLTAAADNDTTHATATLAGVPMADGLWHWALMAVFPQDPTAGVNGSLYVAYEGAGGLVVGATVSPPAALPAGPFNSPGIIASLGRNRILAFPGMQVAALIVTEAAIPGPLDALAALGADGLRDYLVALDKCTVNAQVRSDMRATWGQFRVIAELVSPAPVVVVAAATEVHVDAFEHLPGPNTYPDVFTTTGGVLFFGRAPGPFDVRVFLSADTTASRLFTFTFKIGLNLLTVPIVFETLVREVIDVTSGGTRLVNVIMGASSFMPPIGAGPETEIALFVEQDGAVISLDFTPEAGSLNAIFRGFGFQQPG